MSWIKTYGKSKFDVLKPEEWVFDLQDISQGLSQTCRFSGQCNKFYSVGEHSVRVSLAVERMSQEMGLSPELVLYNAKWGLMHDASEAFLPDMPSPFKRLPQLAGFRELEAAAMKAIVHQVGLMSEEPKEVRECDSRILHNERLQLFADLTWDSEFNPLSTELIWHDKYDFFSDYFIGWEPELAKKAFEKRFEELFTS